MKNKLPLFLTIAISLVLLMITYSFWGQLHTLLLPVSGNGFYTAPPLEKTFVNHVLFSIATGLMPLIVYWTWKYAPVTGKQKRIGTVLVILLSITLTIIFHRYQVTGMINHTLNPALQAGIPLSQVHFEKYLLSGFVAGVIISWFLLRETKYQSAVRETGTAT
ncbi:hypothetical protein ACFS6H_05845 [Terrimonas rubra]|uniref:DUF4293 family protein n=1 Tax=Terrimonas rubra TaxID=1035890 RepID=A0ABW6A1Q1_9BACT